MRRPPVVQLHDVSRTYPGFPPVHALNACNLKIDDGDYLSVIGPSGSGKSTMLNLLGLLDRPSSGSYLLDGEDVSALSERARTQMRGAKIGFVFQSFQLLAHRTALENVKLPLMYQGIRGSDQRERAEAVLEQVGLGHRVLAPPTHMSGGERQRVAVARALVTQPRLLLCDEPTGNLDSTTTEQIMRLLDLLNGQGTTIVLITHDPNVADRGRRRIAITDGQMKEVTSDHVQA